MAGGRIRARLKRSSLYTFGCIRPPRDTIDEPHQFQGPGFSRHVCCNQPGIHRKKPLKYSTNYISTTKYNVISFLPKALFEQFRRVANFYFLLAAALSLTPVSPFSPYSMIAPLMFVVGLSMAKEAVENFQRFMQDMEVNMRKVLVHVGDGVFVRKPWMKLEVGNVVKVEKDQFFPADLLFLSSSYEDGICYVETMNLDGETNLKVKRSLEVTLPLDDDASYKDFRATIKCEDPNPNLYTFVGNFEYDRQTYPLDPSHILLRDSKLRNTGHVYGVVIFSGHDSKVMQNTTKSPSKRSTIEKQMDKIIYILFTLLVLISLISSIGFAIKTKYQMPNWWYIPADHQGLYDPNKALLSGFSHLITALILYGYLIPISLYVSIELVKVLQALFINQDIQMYDEETCTPAQARTSNLNEELGMVDTILSDKTGTLTCNQMDFLKCSIAGIPYGTRSSEVELAAASQMAMDLDGHDQEFSRIGAQSGPEIELEVVPTPKSTSSQNRIKGFSFEDSRLMNGNWVREPNKDIILLFFRILALCHTAIPELNEETGTFNYEAESPDEGAFLVAAREFGFEYCKRTQSSIFVRERHISSHEPVEREYKLLNILDFTSKRKRMSVIVQDETGQILLLCKGADSIIFERLSKNGRVYEEATKKHLNEYAEAGLRTLAFAYRKLEVSEYSSWNDEFMKAKTSIGGDRDAMLEHLSDIIEKDLILVGATAVEDKLQQGVPQCIDKLAQAGLKIWVLTGDKIETAINIGFACSLLRQGMKQICITTNGDMVTHTSEVIKENILMQITNASQMVHLEKDPHAAFALIIDGKTLTYALEDDMKHHFLNLAIDCASVLCCRVSPKQKALVTRLVKQGTRKTTLAIGDGANDVGMIQEADIGVGISGAEGMQMDYSSGEESEFSDSEISEYKDKPYEQLRNGTLKVKYPNGILRCPFCAGKKKQSFKYKDLLQHASGVSKGSSNRNAKQKASHLALKFYLEIELADEAETPLQVAAPVPAAPIYDKNNLFCWPWTGVVVNIVKDPDSGNDFDNPKYWMKRFSKYKPEDVELLWDAEKRTAQALVWFENGLIGLCNAMEFEKAFVADHHSKKEFSASEIRSGIYAWLARASDSESEGPIGDYLRSNMDLKTISDVEEEVVKTRNKLVVELATEIDMRNETLEDLQNKCNQKAMCLSRMGEDIDKMHQAFYDERRRIQFHAQERLKRVFAERDMLNADLETWKKKVDSWSKELNKKEAFTEREKKKLDEEKRKNDMQNSSLHMASLEQEKANDSALRLMEEQKREMEEALQKVLELERQLDAKHTLEMEIVELKGKLRMMKHLGDEDDVAVQEQIKKMEDELEAKTLEMNVVEETNQALVVKERESNDELQKARKELIKGMKDMKSGCTNIGVKRMGEIHEQPFYDACKKKFKSEEAQIKALELCSLWQEKLKNPEWHPVKVVAVDGAHEEVINENDELLKTLR